MMDKKPRTNYKVFNDELRPLYTREQASNVIRFNTYSTIQTNTAIWTPATGKRICLTALAASAPAAMVITLSRAANASFLVIVLTATLATFSESFSSPLIFAVNERISLTTTVQQTVNITSMGYEV